MNDYFYCTLSVLCLRSLPRFYLLIFSRLFSISSDCLGYFEATMLYSSHCYTRSILRDFVRPFGGESDPDLDCVAQQPYFQKFASQ